MPEFWNNLTTEKSRQLLKQLNKEYQFILIGGWAVFVYTEALKSKDIDIVIDYKELSRFQNDFDVFKNERFKKYEIKTQGVDVDIYVSYFSNPGLPAEDIKNYTQGHGGFQVPLPEALLIMKQQVFEQRKGSSKGEKDKIDIFSLIALPYFNWQRYQEILEKYGLLELKKDLQDLLQQTSEVKQLGLSQYKTARLKKKVLQELRGVKN